MLVINCFSDKEPDYVEGERKSNRSSPEESASFISRMVYQWFDGMAWKGYHNPLEMTDLWDLSKDNKARTVVDKFEKYWQKAVSKRMLSKPSAEHNASFQNGDVEIRPSVSFGKPAPVVSVLPALCKAFGGQFLLGACLKVVQDMLQFVSPQILKLLIDFVKRPEDEAWKGYLYALVMTATALVQTVFLNQYFHRMFIVGMHIRTAVVASV